MNYGGPQARLYEEGRQVARMRWKARRVDALVLDGLDEKLAWEQADREWHASLAGKE